MAATIAVGATPVAAVGPTVHFGPLARIPPDRQCATDAPAKDLGDAWALRMVGADVAASLAAGASVTVAVLDTGVDAGHPQLAGAVHDGLDRLYPGGGPGNWDCIGSGTGVASVIAARPRTGTILRGVAPRASILPIVVGEQQDGQGRLDDGQATALATAITDAVHLGATVIAIPVVLYEDSDAVRGAVAQALSDDVVLVAAVGDGATTADILDLPAYPAAYRGVIGVGAVDRLGLRRPSSQVGATVDLMAPGLDVLAAGLGGGYRFYGGTGIATGFVAGAAAVLRSAFPDMSATDVIARLYATADPSYGGHVPDVGPSPEYGYGVVNVYRALTEVMGGPHLTAAPMPSPVDHRTNRWQGGVGWAAVLGGAGLALAILLAVAPAVIRHGRRRGWQPGQATLPRPRSTAVHPTTRLFDDAPP